MPASAPRSKEVRAGDIAGRVGLKDVITGDTLCDLEEIITLEKMEFPAPVISVAVEPKTKPTRKRWAWRCSASPGRPLIRVHTDQEVGADDHLRHGRAAPGRFIVDRMKREFKVEAKRRQAAVAYREPFGAKVGARASSYASRAVRGQYGHVWLKLEPNEQGKGYEFINGVVGGSVPREYVPAVDKGIKEAVETGVIAGYPVVDVKVTLFDGSYHDVDSNEMAFKIAGSIGFKGRLQARGSRCCSSRS